MTARRSAAALALALSAASVAFAQSDDKQEGSASEQEASRVGTCEDARSQMAYFCDEKNSASDTMVTMGTACTNAKNNVKEACEGVVQADKEYKFND